MKRISAIDRERDLILATLNQCGGNRVQVCKTLGIHRVLLNKKLDQYAAQGFTQLDRERQGSNSFSWPSPRIISDP
jgi:DNA-binding NtrC family response regulator